MSTQVRTPLPLAAMAGAVKQCLIRVQRGNRASAVRVYWFDELRTFVAALLMTGTGTGASEQQLGKLLSCLRGPRTGTILLTMVCAGRRAARFRV